MGKPWIHQRALPAVNEVESYWRGHLTSASGLLHTLAHTCTCACTYVYTHIHMYTHTLVAHPHTNIQAKINKKTSLGESLGTLPSHTTNKQPFWRDSGFTQIWLKVLPDVSIHCSAYIPRFLFLRLCLSHAENATVNQQEN